MEVKMGVKTGVKTEVKPGINTRVKTGFKPGVITGIQTEVTMGVKTRVKTGVKPQTAVKPRVATLVTDPHHANSTPLQNQHLFQKLQNNPWPRVEAHCKS